MAIFDRNLLKYAFRYSFTLFQSSYSFGTDTDPIIWRSSPCHYLPSWFIAFGYNLQPYSKNSYVCIGVTDAEQIGATIKGYYVATNNKCAPYL